jgi:hypothetical protein
MSRLLSRCRNGNRRVDHSQVAKKTVRVENGVRVLLAREHTVRRSSGSKGRARPLSEAVSGGSGARRGALSEAWPRQAREAFPPIGELAALAEEAAGDTAEVYSFRLPHDLWDNFAAAGWRRPEVYLDPDVRAGMSAFALAEPRAVEEGVGRLRRDLAGGAWPGAWIGLCAISGRPSLCSWP